MCLASKSRERNDRTIKILAKAFAAGLFQPAAAELSAVMMEIVAAFVLKGNKMLRKADQWKS